MSGYSVGDRVEVLWKGTLYAANIVYVDANEGWCDAVYEIDNFVGVYLTAEEHGLKLSPYRAASQRRCRRVQVAPAPDAAAEVERRFRNGCHASIKVKVKEVLHWWRRRRTATKNRHHSHHFRLCATYERESTARKFSALLKAAPPTL